MTWFESLPKVEIHLHIEGAIPHEALWELVNKYGGDPDVHSLQALQSKFTYQDFPHFINTWIWKNNFLREYEDFRYIGEAVSRDLAEQHIHYVEAYCSPPDFKRHGLKPQEIITSLRAGFNHVPEIEVALIPDLVRDFGPEEAAKTLTEISEVRDQGVIGIGLGGSEQEFPPHLFEDVFAQARSLGLHTCAHAGEAAGAQSIWGALRNLRVERIGHGTRAFEDEKLVEYLNQHQIPVEMCPISNVKTGVVPSIEAHPIRDYFERGLLVTVNTDDPKMFGNTLAEEYELLVQKLDFTTDDICELILNAIQATWLPESRKQQFRNAFLSHPAWRGPKP
jgi:adenosine deaminase